MHNYDDDTIAAQRETIEALRKENTLLRQAARVIYYRPQMTSGSLEMYECDDLCRKVGLEVWKWPLHFKEDT